jgi:hypothetical protein
MGSFIIAALIFTVPIGDIGGWIVTVTGETLDGTPVEILSYPEDPIDSTAWSHCLDFKNSQIDMRVLVGKDGQGEVVGSVDGGCFGRTAVSTVRELVFEVAELEINVSVNIRWNDTKEPNHTIQPTAKAAADFNRYEAY